MYSLKVLETNACASASVEFEPSVRRENGFRRKVIPYHLMKCSNQADRARPSSQMLRLRIQIYSELAHPVLTLGSSLDI